MRTFFAFPEKKIVKFFDSKLECFMFYFSLCLDFLSLFFYCFKF